MKIKEKQNNKKETGKLKSFFIANIQGDMGDFLSPIENIFFFMFGKKSFFLNIKTVKKRKFSQSSFSFNLLSFVVFLFFKSYKIYEFFFIYNNIIACH